MSTEIATTEFNYEGYKIKTITDDNNEPWFLAADVLNILELNHTTKALTSLDDDEKLTVPIVQSGQNRHMIFISESGLYTLIFKSRKPKAKPFMRWVTHEVLPQIRQTGMYYKSTTISQAVSKYAMYAFALMSTSRAFDLKSIAAMFNFPAEQMVKILGEIGILNKYNIPRTELINHKLFKVYYYPDGHDLVRVRFTTTKQGLELIAQLLLDFNYISFSGE